MIKQRTRRHNIMLIELKKKNIHINTCAYMYVQHKNCMHEKIISIIADIFYLFILYLI